MKNAIYILLAVFASMMLSTCGTARAIVGDYADDIIIRNIRPLSNVSGEAVTFEIDICTTAGAKIDPLSGELDGVQYTWDFGGGAEPNVSFDEAPEVVIRDGLRAPYLGTVTIRGGCVPDDDEVTATFTIDVAPLSVISVTPGTGVAGSNATFSALIGAGNVTAWAWDFGGSANPGGSTAEAPTVTFDAFASGVFLGSVIVSNDFEAFEFPFTISVIPTAPAP